MHLVLLAPHPAPPEIKAIINQSLNRHRMTYLVGPGLDPSDYKRARITYVFFVSC
jgi:hypothetical protein